MEKTIIIPGILRSGTSLTAQIVQALGVNFGNDFQPADDFNPYGYFENRAFRRLNDKILGGDRYNVPLAEKAVETFSDEARELIDNQRAKLGNLWGWKEVKTALTLPVYYPHLVNPYIIICQRNEKDTAKSFAKIESFHLDEGQALDIVKLHLASLDKFIRTINSPVIHIQFEDYFKEGGFDEQVSRISKFLKIPIPKDFYNNVIFDRRLGLKNNGKEQKAKGR